MKKLTRFSIYHLALVIFLFLLVTFHLSFVTIQAQTSQTHVIHITKYGFTPQKVEVVQGSTIQFINDDRVPHWPASDPHPTHTIYPELDSKQGLVFKGKFEFKADKVGIWEFHDHLSPTHKGQLIIDQTSYRTPQPEVIKSQNRQENGGILTIVITWLQKLIDFISDVK